MKFALCALAQVSFLVGLIGSILWSFHKLTEETKDVKPVCPRDHVFKIDDVMMGDSNV